MSLNFGAVSSFLKQRQNEELGKDKYNGKCQEIQDFVTNEVFRSSGRSVHKCSVFVCLAARIAGQFKIRGHTGYRKSGRFWLFLSLLNNLPFIFMTLLVFRTTRITAFLFQNMIWQVSLGVTEHLSLLLMSTGSYILIQLNSSFLSGRTKNSDFCP